MKLSKALQWLCTAALLSLLSACATVDRLSDYRFDPIIDTESNNKSVFIRANVHFLRNGTADTYSAPWGSKQNEQRYDSLLVEVKVPELQYQRRFLLAAHANIARTYAPPHDEHFIPAMDNSGKYEVLPWAMMFEGLELAPKGPIDVDLNLTALNLDLNSVLNNTPALPLLSAQRRIHLSSERLSKLLVPHWPVNKGIAAAKQNGSIKSFVRVQKAWTKSMGGQLFSFVSSNSGINNSFEATSCYPEVRLSKTGDAFPKPAADHVYLRPKSYQVEGEDLLHFLARSDNDIWGFIAATNLLDKCTDFQVTDQRGNTFMHNYLHKVRDSEMLNGLLGAKYFYTVCMEPNEEGKNCIDTLLERGYADRVVELVNKGNPLDYYGRQDIAHTAKRGLPKADYQQLLAELAPLDQECDRLYAAIKRLDKVACSYKDSYGDRHYSQRCDSNKEQAIKSLRSSSSQVCGQLSKLRREATPRFGPYERLNFSNDLAESPVRRQVSMDDFRRKYPTASIDLKGLADADFSEVLAEQNLASTMVANLQASESRRQGINAPLKQSYQTANAVTAGSTTPSTQSKTPAVAAGNGVALTSRDGKAAEGVSCRDRVYYISGTTRWSGNTCSKSDSSVKSNSVRFEAFVRCNEGNHYLQELDQRARQRCEKSPYCESFRKSSSSVTANGSHVDGTPKYLYLRNYETTCKAPPQKEQLSGKSTTTR
jgi:hypothetical protein